jgi:hypothetical protein
MTETLVPRKRRQLEAADAADLATWAADPELPEPDRRRAQAERDRRKQLRRRTGAGMVGVIVGVPGASPPQIEALLDELDRIKPVQIVHPYASSKLHQACKAGGAVVIVERGPITPELQIRCADEADVVVGLSPNPVMPEQKDGDVWKALRRAKDRGADVVVLWPDGSRLTGRW